MTDWHIQQDASSRNEHISVQADKTSVFNNGVASLIVEFPGNPTKFIAGTKSGVEVVITKAHKKVILRDKNVSLIHVA